MVLALAESCNISGRIKSQPEKSARSASGPAAKPERERKSEAGEQWQSAHSSSFEKRCMHIISQPPWGASQVGIQAYPSAADVVALSPHSFMASRQAIVPVLTLQTPHPPLWEAIFKHAKSPFTSELFSMYLVHALPRCICRKSTATSCEDDTWLEKQLYVAFSWLSG